MARILQFPSGKARKTARKSASQDVDRGANPKEPSYRVAVDVIRYFQVAPVSFETLEFLHKGISMIYRERRQFERER